MCELNDFKKLLTLGASLVAVSACNVLTGADAVTFYDGDEELVIQGGGGAEPSAVGSGGSSNAASSSGSGASATTGPGATAGSGGGPGGPLALADGIDVTRIALYQGVERPLMVNDAPASARAPVVAQRPAMMRVFYQTTGAFDGGLVTARLTIGTAAPIDVQTVPSGGASTDGSLASTINFDIDSSLITAGASYRVELLQPSGSGDNADAAYPEQGQADLEVESGGTLQIKIVPIQYNGDGSGRMPDTSASQIQLLEDGFFRMYPVSDVQLTVRSAIGFNGTLAASGSGWSTLLNALADLRQSDNAPDDVYYYGVVEPASTSTAYCGGGCVAGLGFTAPSTSTYQRASLGLGYAGAQSVEYALHEIGHNHGRGHAPCGTSGSDASFPYATGGIGGWGYDLLTATLKSPSNHRDLMGYCQPRWISDHNFAKIFDRIQLVDSAFINIPPALQNLTWDRLLIHPDGTVSSAGSIQLNRPPFGEGVTLTVHSSTGPTTVTGQLTRYDHVGGGLLFVPPTAAGPKQVRGTIDGSPLDAWLP